MGRTFLRTIFLLALYRCAVHQGWENSARASEIAWPSEPGSIAAPINDEPLLKRQPARRHNSALENPNKPDALREKSAQEPSALQNQPSTAQKVMPIAKDQRPSGSVLLNLALHYPWIHTSGKKRRDYDSEPSVNIEALINAATTAADQWQVWYGCGLTSIQGRGIYNDLAGRFGYLLVGPRLAFTKLKSFQMDLSDSEEADGKKAGPAETGLTAMPKAWQSLQSFSLGLNLRISTKRYEKSLQAGDNEDFSSKVVFDRPGLSARYFYHFVYIDGFAFGPGFGALLLKGKSIYWLEAGASLFL